MKIPESVKSLCKSFGSLCVSAYNDYSTALNDTTKMYESDNKILSVSSSAFCYCFRDVALQISYTRPDKNADTYCMLAEKAVEMLASGKSETDTLYYFDELLRKEIKGE